MTAHTDHTNPSHRKSPRFGPARHQKLTCTVCLTWSWFHDSVRMDLRFILFAPNLRLTSLYFRSYRFSITLPQHVSVSAQSRKLANLEMQRRARKLVDICLVEILSSSIACNVLTTQTYIILKRNVKRAKQTPTESPTRTSMESYYHYYRY